MQPQSFNSISDIIQPITSQFAATQASSILHSDNVLQTLCFTNESNRKHHEAYTMQHLSMVRSVILLRVITYGVLIEQSECSTESMLSHNIKLKINYKIQQKTTTDRSAVGQ